MHPEYGIIVVDNKTPQRCENILRHEDWIGSPIDIVTSGASLVKGLAFSMAQYQAYSPDTKLKQAIKMYSKKTGAEPSIIVVPDTYEVNYLPDDVTLLTSANCSVIMITSDSESEFETMEITELVPKVGRAGDITGNSNKPDTSNIKRLSHATCPHCKNNIRDWSVLGHYWGTSAPPYWEHLARHVFKRDKYTCGMCREQFDIEYLDAHHIVPRDKGGPDSDDNLITLCNDCHDWLHEYYEGAEERSGKQIHNFEPIMRP
jgi:5-methylcytosine-specific restriction endonuclease McrA